MGDKSEIAWTDATWNCLVGCTRVSAGCTHCYAERLVHRGLSPQHRGLTRIVNGAPHWTGEVRLVESALDLPLRWQKPRRIFVNSMSDLFHEVVPDEWIDRIFGVMAKAHWHTFQALTKRPARMLDYLTGPAAGGRHIWEAAQAVAYPTWAITGHEPRGGWPLPNVWLGVSVEDQATADARIPILLQTPAAVRWVSYEPALGPVDFSTYMYETIISRPPLDWIVVGGESGPGARPFDLAWARQTITQGRAAGVPVFVKQLGAWPIVPARKTFDSFQTWVNKASSWLISGDLCIDSVGRVLHNGADFMRARDGGTFPVSIYERLPLRDRRKGADLAEWPPDLRVREYPGRPS